MTRIMVVGCGFPQLSLVRAAKRRGYHVIGADANPRAVGVKHCDDFIEVSTGDVEGLMGGIRRLGARAVTTTGSEVSLKATAVVAQRTGMPFYADPETVRRCQDKDEMRAAYAARDVAVPDFARCRTVEEAITFARARKFPLVVKPSRGWGQRGVARVDELSQVPEAFADARAHSMNAGLAHVVVEEWLEGREVSVNGWVEAGRLAGYCVTERITVPGNKPLGVMVAEVYPPGSRRRTRPASSTRRAAGRPRSATPAGPATRRSPWGRAAASCSRPPRAWAVGSTPT